MGEAAATEEGVPGGFEGAWAKLGGQGDPYAWAFRRDPASEKGGLSGYF